MWLRWRYESLEGAEESRARVPSLNRSGFGRLSIASCCTCCWPGGLVLKPKLCVRFRHLARLARSENSNLEVDAAGAPVICVATLVAHCCGSLAAGHDESKFLSCLSFRCCSYIHLHGSLPIMLPIQAACIACLPHWY